MKFLVAIFFLTSLLFSAVDINTASAEELATLKGIGAKKAKRILEYKAKHGCFKDLEEFTKVKGIKKKVLKKNKGNIVVSECKK